MTKRHLSRIAVPKTWPLPRKGIKFIVRPKPGPHKLEMSLPLGVVLRDILKLASTMDEVKYLLRTNEVLIDGKKVIEPNRALGFMDVLSLPAMKKSYRVSINQKGLLTLKEAEDSESKFKIEKITGKKMISKGKIAIYLHDGRSLITSEDFAVGDSIIYEFASKKAKRLDFKEGATVILTGGKHVGQVGKITKIAITKKSEDLVVVKTNDGEFTGLKKQAFVIGKDKAEIKI